MPLLSFLVSILAFNLRNKNHPEENVDDNVKNASLDDKPADRRIDIPVPGTRGETSTPSSLSKPANYREGPRSHSQRRRSSIFIPSVAVVKKPLTLTRSILHACRQFIFKPDKELEDGYSPQYRYLPIISGLLVPFSILLEVPGLTEHWYQRQEGLQIVEYQENPAILNVGLGFSMASALLANICLILRFLERRIKSATVAAICLLLVHDIINIIALVSFGVIHAVDDGFTYSQAYYVTLASTITSLSVTATLILDYFRTSNFTKSGSGLTRKQRSLVIIVMILLSYLGIGALIYCFMMDIHFLDALYFAVCSSLTIGFGDISPSNSHAQVFSIFYNTFGILNTGLAIAIARETIVEAFQQSYRNRKHALAARRKMYRQIHAKHYSAKHGIWLATHRFNGYLPDGIDIPVSSTPPTPPREPSIKDPGSVELSRQQPPPRDGSPTPSRIDKEAGKEELVADPYHAEKLEENIIDEGNDPTPEATPTEPKKKPFLGRLKPRLSTTSGHSGEGGAVKIPEDSQDVIAAEREEAREQAKKVDEHMIAGFGEEESEYIQFRQDMIKEERKDFKAKLLVSWGLFIVFWVFGGVIFMLSEGWSYGIAIYFCFTAFSTIGYGDFAPKTGPGRVCFIAWSLLGVGTMTILISVLSEAYQSRYSTLLHNGLFDKAIRSYQNKTHTQTPYPDTPTYDKDNMTVAERRRAREETREQMAAIPPKIIVQAKVFHAHLQYVLTHNNQEKPPPGLQRALDELMDEEKMNEELRKEVLQDGEARRTLFMMSFERTLKRMVENAERVSKLIEQQKELEEALGWELNLDDDEILDPDENLDEGDDVFPNSPGDMHHGEGSLDVPASKSRDGNESEAIDSSVSKKGNAMAHWLKAYSMLLGPKARRSATNDNMQWPSPYLHTGGSQSEPWFLRTEEGEEEEHDSGVADTVIDGGNGSKGKGSAGSSFLSPRKRHSRPPLRRPGKSSGVRFADDPYGDHQHSARDNNMADDITTRQTRPR